MSEDVEQIKLWHTNGELAMILGANKKQRFHGDFKRYHSNGLLEEEVTNVDGVKQGLAKYYDEDGKLNCVRLYKNGSSIQDFSLQLKVMQYFDDLKAGLGIKKRCLNKLNEDQVVQILKQNNLDLS